MRLYPILYHVEAEESMDGTTQFLGQMISLYLVATGVGFFVSKDYYRKMLADSGRWRCIRGRRGVPWLCDVLRISLTARPPQGVSGVIQNQPV